MWGVRVQFVQVLVDCPTEDRLFTYTWPKAEGPIQPGDGVWVPFGNREVGGIVLTTSTENPHPDRVIKAVLGLLHRGFLPVHYWNLLEQTAQYYHASLLQVVQCALPAGILSRPQRRILWIDGDLTGTSQAAQQLWHYLAHLKQQSAAWQTLRREFSHAESSLKELQARGLVESYLYRPVPPKPKTQTWVTLIDPLAIGATPRQRQILQTLQHQGGELLLAQLLSQTKTTRPTIHKLSTQGWISVAAREILRQGAPEHPDQDQPQQLTPKQNLALQQIQALGPGETLLLWGITGSGKTEVYLQAIAPVLAQGQSALVLVPEIGLTPQLTERFQRRFPGQVWVYHSALSAGERYDSWRQMLTGEPQVVIGTRSAIFVPLPHLGLVILDEEHDPSYKQDRPAPSYHARTLAQWRAKNEHCPLVLGSATPALESYYQAQKGAYRLAVLPERVRAVHGLPP